MVGCSCTWLTWSGSARNFAWPPEPRSGSAPGSDLRYYPVTGGAAVLPRARAKVPAMKRSKAFRFVWPLIAAALLTSCSLFQTMASRDTTRRALLDAYAGKPITHITYVEVGPGLLVISATQLVTWTDFTQAHAYLITVGQGCANLYTTGAHVTSTGNQIWAHSDHVFAGGACEINRIQPVDWLRVQRELARMDQSGQYTLPTDATTRGS